MGSIRINISTALVVTLLVMVSALEPYAAAAEQVNIHEFHFLSKEKYPQNDSKINVSDSESHFSLVEEKRVSGAPARL